MFTSGLALWSELEVALLQATAVGFVEAISISFGMYRAGCDACIMSKKHRGAVTIMLHITFPNSDPVAATLPGPFSAGLVQQAVVLCVLLSLWPCQMSDKHE